MSSRAKTHAVPPITVPAFAAAAASFDSHDAMPAAARSSSVSSPPTLTRVILRPTSPAARAVAWRRLRIALWLLDATPIRAPPAASAAITAAAFVVFPEPGGP